MKHSADAWLGSLKRSLYAKIRRNLNLIAALDKELNDLAAQCGATPEATDNNAHNSSTPKEDQVQQTIAVPYDNHIQPATSQDSSQPCPVLDYSNEHCSRPCSFESVSAFNSSSVNSFQHLADINSSTSYSSTQPDQLKDGLLRIKQEPVSDTEDNFADCTNFLAESQDEPVLTICDVSTIGETVSTRNTKSSINLTTCSSTGGEEKPPVTFQLPEIKDPFSLPLVTVAEGVLDTTAVVNNTVLNPQTAVSCASKVQTTVSSGVSVVDGKTKSPKRRRYSPVSKRNEFHRRSPRFSSNEAKNRKETKTENECGVQSDTQSDTSASLAFVERSGTRGIYSCSVCSFVSSTVGYVTQHIRSSHVGQSSAKPGESALVGMQSRYRDRAKCMPSMKQSLQKDNKPRVQDSENEYEFACRNCSYVTTQYADAGAHHLDTRHHLIKRKKSSGTLKLTIKRSPVTDGIIDKSIPQSRSYARSTTRKEARQSKPRKQKFIKHIEHKHNNIRKQVAKKSTGTKHFMIRNRHGNHSSTLAMEPVYGGKAFISHYKPKYFFGLERLLNNTYVTIEAGPNTSSIPLSAFYHVIDMQPQVSLKRFSSLW